MTVFVLDTNVLISAISRDFFMELGKRGLAVRWSPFIEKEFTRVRARDFPHLSDKTARVLGLMRIAVPDWKAPEARRVRDACELPDPDDVRVVAAAVGAGAQVIVTNNLRDFPGRALKPFGLVALSPDDVLCALFDADPQDFVDAASAMRARLTDPPVSLPEWLAALRRSSLPNLADRLDRAMGE